ncbi:hypothetical protein H0H93_006673 [Arthromyces matolae]|nr:hypothetical protein H0H93_006673 [Arthromyces matolae]
MGQFSILSFLYEQLSRSPPVEKRDLTGKTVMVIGANTGIGFETSKHFALMSPERLILVCRSKTKGEAAIEKLEKETNYKYAELWIVDLSNFASVIAFVDKFERDGGRLDILVENAAVATTTYTATTDGFETTFVLLSTRWLQNPQNLNRLQVNCLSLYLIALRLLPQMMKTAAQHATHPRLVIVTSEVHFWSQIPEQKDLLQGHDIYKTMSRQDFCETRMKTRYEDSKLLDILFHRALNERLGGKSPVIINGVNPGFCYSELRREFSGLQLVYMWLMEKALARTSEEGARQLVYAALGGYGKDEKEDKFRGAYVSNTKVCEASDFVIGREGQKFGDRLLDEVIGILENVDPKVDKVVHQYINKIQ